MFAPDNTGAMVLRGGSFMKLVEWVLAASSLDEKSVQNFVVAYRQWRPPLELWRVIMEKYGAIEAVLNIATFEADLTFGKV